jgi:hypothetical protein
MKMKNCTTGLLIACLCLLSSCRNRDTIRPGNYQISGITKTPLADFKIIYDCVLPVFEFRKGGTLCVFPDFNFGYFKDSLFTYKLKGGYLHLNGQHIKHKIVCEPYTIGNKHCYELFLDSELIIKIFITKND